MSFFRRASLNNNQYDASLSRADLSCDKNVADSMFFLHPQPCIDCMSDYSDSLYRDRRASTTQCLLFPGIWCIMNGREHTVRLPSFGLSPAVLQR